MAKKFLDLDGFKYFISKIIGKTDISSIGEGTLTSAISAMNTWVNIEASSIWDSHPGFIFSDENSDVCILGGHLMVVHLNAEGSIKADADGRILLGTLKEAYKPKIDQVSPILVNTLQSGQMYFHALVMINENGRVYLVTGGNGTVYGNSSYPWTTLSGASFSWWI